MSIGDLVQAMSRARWLLSRHRDADADLTLWHAMRPYWRPRRGPSWRIAELLAILPADSEKVSKRLGLRRQAASLLLARAVREGWAVRTGRGQYAAAIAATQEPRKP
jgi:hypothetical protein